MKILSQILATCFLLISCNKNDDVIISNSEKEEFNFVSAVDISSYPELSIFNPIFYDLNGDQKDFFDLLKNNGINTIRLRLWVNPVNEHSGFNEVKQFSQSLKGKGFKTWLTLHYSDTWADPGNQKLPFQWQENNFNALKNNISNYTTKVVTELQPDFIQIGNEINSGFLHPHGHISNNYGQFIQLMQTAIQSVRTNSANTEIIIHYAGIDQSDWFFNQVNSLDYDIIGLSYYPIWHGKSLNDLKSSLQELSITFNKNIVIAETAYPFNLDWKDWTNNIVGLEEQLILPEFPASEEGQRKFVSEIIKLTKEVKNGIGFCYWGAELIAWKGDESTDASPWENQALFNFENVVVPALLEFNK